MIKMENTREKQVERVRGIGDHPCFNRGVRHRLGRVHLPVAPRCNIKCNYCSRRFDCAHEGRPGVTSRLMDPGEALAYLAAAMNESSISVAGIAGPGDALANPESTFRTLALVRAAHPGLLTCLSTNGLAAIHYIDEIAEYASHVTITVNAVDEKIGARIYRYVLDGSRVLTGETAARLLRNRQLEAIGLMKQAGLTVKVNTVMVPGINDHHMLDIARVMRELSVDLFNVMPMLPVEDTPFAGIPEPDAGEVKRVRRLAGSHIPLMTHCARCRSDAAGLIGHQHPVSSTCGG